MTVKLVLIAKKQENQGTRRHQRRQASRSRQSDILRSSATIAQRDQGKRINPNVKHQSQTKSSYAVPAPCLTPESQVLADSDSVIDVIRAMC